MTSPPRRPTIVDVAKEAGVSKSLVSLALRDGQGVGASTRRRIVEVAEQLGYRSNTWAASLARGRSHLIGIVVNDLHSGYHTDIVDGIEDAAASDGFAVVLSHGRRDPVIAAARLDSLGGMGVEAIVVVSGQIDRRDLERASRSRPVVVVGRPHEVPEGIGQVSNDDRLGARLAVHHLAALGHRRIAHVTSSRRPAAEERREAYLETMEQLGLAEHAEILEPDAAFARLSDPAGCPSAVFAANDRLARDLVGAAFDAGVDVPGALSVVGYDDTDLARALRPALTSVEQPRRDMGHRAFALVGSLLAGDQVRHEVIEPRLVVRDSTTAAAGWTVAGVSR